LAAIGGRSQRTLTIGRHRLRASELILALVLSFPAGAAEDPVSAAARRNWSEYLELLAIPNVPDKPEDMRRNAEFLSRAFQKRGFSTSLLETSAGRPLVFVEAAATPSARTILFYIHFDGQPVIPQDWAQKSPFQPVVKKADAEGRWRE